MLMLADGRYPDSLILSALEDIYISRHTSSLPEMIGRSPCRLKKLTIIDGVDIIRILNRVPTLLEIRLQDFAEIARLLAYLTVSPDAGDGSHTICTDLRLLTLWVMKEKNISLASQMVQSRATPIFIFVLTLNTPWTRHSTAYPDLATYMDLGEGTRAIRRFNSWRFDYAGHGK
ncbi:hypothetical protein DFH09DRAFT_554465 [Mycena vulgaris]|nr:hypothetical protein DFH09DRAFT_554465 [Mycena vulgaris]